MATPENLRSERDLRRALKSLAQDEAALERKLAAVRLAKENNEKYLKSLNQRPSISAEKLLQVEEFLAKSGQATAAEITRRTKLNSGSVSVALRRLSEDGAVRPVGKNGERSQTWEIVDPQAVAA